MATSPQPPRPPVAPPPPRSSSHVVAIALLVLALIIVVSGIAVWTGFRYLSQQVKVQVEEGGAGKKEVSIKTPLGSLEVRKGVNEARLGLPLYPGATRLPDQDTATVNIDIAGEENVRVLAAKFETPDPLAKVRDFYRDRLGSEVTKFTQNTHEGKTVFEIKGADQEKVVALKESDGKTRIELVRVAHGQAGVN
jgi:hypothetical protein